MHLGQNGTWVKSHDSILNYCRMPESKYSGFTYETLRVSFKVQLLELEIVITFDSETCVE